MKSHEQSYYEILGVERAAEKSQIRKAYFELAKRYHPDKEGGDEAKFREINEAYNCLIDPEKRKEYDETGTFTETTQMDDDFGSGFTSFFPFKEAPETRMEDPNKSKEDDFVYREEYTRIRQMLRNRIEELLRKILPADQDIKMSLLITPNTKVESFRDFSFALTDIGKLAHLRQDRKNPNIIYLDRLDSTYNVNSNFQVSVLHRMRSYAYIYNEAKITFEPLDKKNIVPLEKRLRALNKLAYQLFDKDVVSNIARNLQYSLEMREIGKILAFYSRGINDQLTQNRLAKLNRNPDSKDFIICKGDAANEICICYMENGKLQIQRDKFYAQGSMVIPELPRGLKQIYDKLVVEKAKQSHDNFKREWKDYPKDMKDYYQSPSEKAYEEVRLFKRSRDIKLGAHRSEPEMKANAKKK